MRSFPGGLRAQMLVVFGVLLVGAALIAALLVENVLARRLLETRASHARAAAEAIESMDTAARSAMVARGVVDAIILTDEQHGAPSLLRELDRDQRFVTVDGRTYLRVKQRPTIVAVRVDDLQADVAAARGMLIVFGVLVLIVLLALGFAFFSFAIVRPIRALAVATERAGQGDFASQIAREPRNELGRLTRSFNEMLTRIDASQDALERKLVELQLANTELEATRDSLVRSEKLASVGHLAAGIAHEIGNPLAAVSGYNELLLDGDLDPDEQHELLERTGVQLDRIRGVIRNLLDFSRDERGLPPGPIDLAACVRETVSLVKPTASKGIKFQSTNVDGPLAWGVAPQLTQVLVNLGINAADAIGETGCVQFAREDLDAEIHLLVDDDGPGIEPDVASRIFDPFFTTKDPGQGTGLGLAISARIMQDMGGDLRVEESPLGGARFVVVIPQPSEEH